MESAKLTTALTITMIVLVAFTSSGAMAQEFGTAPAPSPSMESAGMALPVPALLAAVVSLSTFDVSSRVPCRMSFDDPLDFPLLSSSPSIDDLSSLLTVTTIFPALSISQSVLTVTTISPTSTAGESTVHCHHSSTISTACSLPQLTT
ncbi:hypothetical protein L6452_35912 [Arctium lappa]|uniref:Uncharacterized protein n=1 Tax=Arctium lappa TaxID=4217 RepID=A0ACB8Y8W8_ARCLA|nr:hypothetical protein L6452_35912 [Arctium lappa]